MLGRRNRRVVTVPAVGGGISAGPLRWYSRTGDVDDEGEVLRPKALVVVANRIGEVCRWAKAGGTGMEEGDMSRSLFEEGWKVMLKCHGW